ncbi:MAG TPA: hypothetical protein ENK27_07755 [Desulfobulbus sp.]|nr:hypothetical protein [Desulfobulbus sp.]
MTAKTNTIAKTKTSEKTNVAVQAEVSRGTLVTLGVTGAIVGLWALASLVAGMIAAGGPIALAKAWFSAVTGM